MVGEAPSKGCGKFCRKYCDCGVWQWAGKTFNVDEGVQVYNRNNNQKEYVPKLSLRFHGGKNLGGGREQLPWYLRRHARCRGVRKYLLPFCFLEMYVGEECSGRKMRWVEDG